MFKVKTLLSSSKNIKSYGSQPKELGTATVSFRMDTTPIGGPLAGSTGEAIIAGSAATPSARDDVSLLPSAAPSQEAGNPLRRTLTTFDLTAIGVGGIIGALSTNAANSATVTISRNVQAPACTC
jgi:hypothetical protein